MFKHPKNPTAPDTAAQSPALDSGRPLIAQTTTSDTVTPEHDLRELMEKNLKWSQIIYEQNRKINNKLLWAAIASWVRTVLILIPLVLGILFLPPLLKGVWSQYADLLGNGSSHTTSTPQSLDSVLDLFNIDPAKKEQIKAFLK